MSDRQSLAAAVAARGGTRVLKSCAGCRRVFVRTARAQLYCSAGCKPGRPVPTADRLPCPTCGTAFVKTCNAHRYCSPGCRESGTAEYYQRRAVEQRGYPLGPRGRPKDEGKQAAATALRDAGLTLSVIGARMGISRQRVHQLLTTRDAASVV